MCILVLMLLGYLIGCMVSICICMLDSLRFTPAKDPNQYVINFLLWPFFIWSVIDKLADHIMKNKS